MPELEEAEISLRYPETFDQRLVDELASGILASGPRVRLRAERFSVNASLEFLIPGLVIAAISKAYFDGFLKEAGKDHYQVLKAWLGRLARRCHQMKVGKYTSGPNGIEEVQSESPYSMALSIYYITKQGFRIKLVFNKTMSSEAWEHYSNVFADIMLEHYENYPNDRISRAAKGLPEHETLLAVMNPEEGWQLGTMRTFLPKDIQDKLAENA